MANLKTANPSVIGEGRSAQLSVSPVGVVNTVPSLRGVTEGLTSALNSMAYFATERGEYDYMRTYNQLTSDADKRIQAECLQPVGDGASGALERYESIRTDLWEKVGKAKLSPRNMRRLEEHIGSYANSRYNQVFQHESSELRTANIRQNRLMIDKYSSDAVSAFLIGDMDSAVRAFQGGREAVNREITLSTGQRGINPEGFQALEAEVKQGNLRVGTGDKQKVLKIVEDSEAGKAENTITRSEANRIVDNARNNLAQREAAVSGFNDKIIAKGVDELLRLERFDEADALLKAVQERNIPHNEGLLKVASETVARHWGTAICARQANDIFAKLNMPRENAVSNVQILYGSPEYDAAYTSTRGLLLQKLNAAKTRDEQNRISTVISRLDVMHENKKRMQNSQVVTALATCVDRYQKGTFTLNDMAGQVSNMPPCNLKTALQKFVAAEQKKIRVKKERDIGAIIDREKACFQIEQALRTSGTFTYEGATFNPRNPRELKAACALTQLSDVQVARLGKLASGKYEGITYSEIADCLLKVVKEKKIKLKSPDDGGVSERNIIEAFQRRYDPRYKEGICEYIQSRLEGQILTGPGRRQAIFAAIGDYLSASKQAEKGIFTMEGDVNNARRLLKDTKNKPKEGK